MGIQLTERVLLTINIKDKLPVHYQLAKQTVDHCKQRGVLPHHFGLDATGEGGGLADIIAREWALSIRRIEFGGRPSDRPVSQEENKPAHEVYDRGVTALWFAIKEVTMSNQLKGVDATIAMQLCNRRWKMVAKKISIEPKSATSTSSSNSEDGAKANWGFKQFYGRSPDESDALATLISVAQSNGFNIKAHGAKVEVDQDWTAMALEADSIYVKDEDDQIPSNPIVSIYALDEF